MTYQEFKLCYQYQHESNLSAAMTYFFNQPKEVLENNIPIVAYELPIFEFIQANMIRLDTIQGLVIYEVNGKWQRIVSKIESKNNQ